MTATDVDDGDTRLDVAKDRARALIEELYAGGFMADAPGETMIIAFSDRAEVVCRFTDSKTSLLRSIDRIEPTHGETRLDEALQLARAYTTNPNPDQQDRPMDAPANIELFSDGRVQDLDDQVLRGESLTFYPIGSAETDNVAIAAISVDRPYDRPTAVEVFVSILNYNEAPVDACEIQLSVNGTAVGIQDIDLPAATRAPDDELRPSRSNLVFLPFEQARGAVLDVAILRQDDLHADNLAYIVLPSARQLRVALVEAKSRVLSFALEGLELAELNTTMTREVFESIREREAIDEYDVYVFDNDSPDTLSEGRYLIFGPPPPVSGLNPYGGKEAQVVLATDSEHPTMRYVQFDNVFVNESTLLEPDRDVRIVMEGSEGPLMVEVIRGPLAVLYVAFDPLDSNIPLLRSFPTWVYNTIDYLGHLGEAVASQGIRPGGAVTSRVPAGSNDVTIVTPDGTVRALVPSETNEVSWGPARLSGLHTIRYTARDAGDDVVEVHAVNLLSDVEGCIAPLETIRLGLEDVRGDLETSSAYTPLWPWAVAVCLSLMLTEWWIFHRRARV